MEPAESQQQAALKLVHARLIDTETARRMVGLNEAHQAAINQKILQQAIQEALTMGPVASGLAQMALSRLAAGGKLNQSRTSEERIRMSVVIATVGTIDPMSVCEDPNCAQKGEMMKDHVVVHKSSGKKKGLRGVCPHCEGPLHNVKDDAKLIAFACLWRQAFGDKAKKTPVNAGTLQAVVTQITNREITAWADRSLLLTVLAGPAPKAAPAAPSTSTAASTTSSPTLIGTKPLPTGTAGASTGQPGAAPAATQKVDDPEKKRKLQEMLKGAKVQP